MPRRSPTWPSWRSTPLSRRGRMELDAWSSMHGQGRRRRRIGGGGGQTGRPGSWRPPPGCRACAPASHRAVPLLSGAGLARPQPPHPGAGRAHHGLHPGGQDHRVSVRPPAALPQGRLARAGGAHSRCPQGLLGGGGRGALHPCAWHPLQCRSPTPTHACHARPFPHASTPG